MGLLSDLLTEEEISPPSIRLGAVPDAVPESVAASTSAATVAALASPIPAPANHSAQRCPTCLCPVAWESTYLDGRLRCPTCDPPPSPVLVGRWLECWSTDGAEWRECQETPLPFRTRETRSQAARRGEERYSLPLGAESASASSAAGGAATTAAGNFVDRETAWLLQQIENFDRMQESQVFVRQPPDGVTCDRCGGTAYRDVEIHKKEPRGPSVRRDCARCGRFLRFEVWYGEKRSEQKNPTPNPKGGA